MEFLRKVGWLNLLLVFVPIAIVLKYSGAPQTYVFGASAMAIIPLAGLMGRGTEILADRLGPGIGGLLNASFGNAAELIIALFALHKGLINVVKASITGSIIGNILLVMGASLFAGGLRYKRQTFNVTAAGMSATLLALAAIGLLVPAIFHASVVVDAQSAMQRGLEFPADAHEQELSLEIAVVLFSVYILTLLFSLKTHKHLYDDESTDEADEIPPPPPPEVHAGPHWSPKVALSVLLGATTVVALMSEILVGAIEETSRQLGWSEMFVGVIVVAIVGNAAEHSTAILVAMKNRMGLSIQIAVGSALQIALFVAPVLVFMSYLPGFKELNLMFSMLEVVAIAVSVMIVGLVAYDGESNWLEGLLLLAVYVILGIAFYHLPEAKEAVETSGLPASVFDALGRIV
ncbi:MAG: calcium/proton exchanger [Planctomycetaceae bacterium]|jgi:Ca2+:H+ antiporter|nr:calcium/proton exchanger [Planctomycetaceae bacterium]MBT6156741.1 calcium/proton exchanger [Planctomycetaceae bacterium]MBT6486032.1 calcium/proton exchanger [Planctomycetaceae bacterium]